MTFKIIDLFAGPSGLGEGFAALNEGKTFSIPVQQQGGQVPLQGVRENTQGSQSRIASFAVLKRCAQGNPRTQKQGRKKSKMPASEYTCPQFLIQKIPTRLGLVLSRQGGGI